MNKYFAPLEGITGYIFRNAYEKYYGGIDKYFAPFMSPADNCAMNPKEKRDVLPENNKVTKLVPQILTCKSHHFMDAANVLIDMGYTEINLNLGCPSGTVCAKKKGAGFLSETDDLIVFLDDIYEYAEKKNIEISIKTRTGRYDETEWEYLLEIYNRFPISELIVHPRVGKDFYNGKPRIEQFEYAVKNSKNLLVYNGDIFSLHDLEQLQENMNLWCKNNIDTVMFGRGLIRNPEMFLETEGVDYKRFRQFHDEIYRGYQEIMSPDINVLYRMKELWTYWTTLFESKEKEIKKLLKTKKFGEYETALQMLGL